MSCLNLTCVQIILLYQYIDDQLNDIPSPSGDSFEPNLSLYLARCSQPFVLAISGLVNALAGQIWLSY